MEEPAGEGLGQGRERGPREIRVVPLRLPGERGVHRVVEVVVPLGVHAEAAVLARGDDPRVVQIRLGDQEQRPARVGGQVVHGPGQLLQEVAGARVHQRVHRVQPQPVDAVVPQPRQRAVHQVGAHLVGAGGVQVDRRAPRGVVGVGEVRAELRQMIARRAQVVVHDVQDHTQTQRVRPVDEPLQSVRPAVRLVHRPQRHALVPPPVHAREGTHRHQLHVGHAQLREMTQTFGGGVEGALARERAHVQFVQHRAGQLTPGPLGPPGEPVVVDDRAQPVGTVRLAARTRIGQDGAVVQREAVPRPVPRLGLRPPPPLPLRIALHRARVAVAPERHPAGLRCPHLELHGRFPFVCSP
ncbi:hypothetical protein RKD26_001209 [Streptomyces calvus]